MTLKEELKEAIKNRDLVKAIKVVKESPGVAMEVLENIPSLKEDVNRLLDLMKRMKYKEAYERFKRNPVALAFIPKEVVEKFVDFARQKAFVAELNAGYSAYYGDEKGLEGYGTQADTLYKIGVAFALGVNPRWVPEKQIEEYGRELEKEGIFPEGHTDRILGELKKRKD